MNEPLRVLIIEDSEDDTLLMMRELRRGGFDATYTRVETPAAMSAALEKQSWDIIIADYSMPQFGGPAALTLFKEKGLEIPFISVSGTIGEDIAVQMMKAGAHDYVMKDRLARLVPAVKRELREAEGWRERKQMESGLAHLAAIVESSDDAIIGTTLEGMILSWNKGAERIYGYGAEEMIGRSTSILFPPNRPDELSKIYESMRHGERVLRYDSVRVRKDGRQVDVSVTVSPIQDKSGKIIGASAIARDITERKREEAEHLKLIQELTEALSQVKALTGLLPICAACKKIRDDQGYWQQVETYIAQRSQAEFSHGICPDCMKRLYPEYAVRS